MANNIINPTQQGEVTPYPVAPAGSTPTSVTFPPDGVSAVVTATGPTGSQYVLQDTDYVRCYRKTPGSNEISSLLITVTDFLSLGTTGPTGSIGPTGATGP